MTPKATLLEQKRSLPIICTGCTTIRFFMCLAIKRKRIISTNWQLVNVWYIVCVCVLYWAEQYYYSYRNSISSIIEENCIFCTGRYVQSVCTDRQETIHRILWCAHNVQKQLQCVCAADLETQTRASFVTLASFVFFGTKVRYVSRSIKIDFFFCKYY